MVLFRMRRQTVSRTVRSWNLFALKAVRFKVRLRGGEGIDEASPMLIVSNHQSLFDIPAAFAALPGEIRMAAKKELFRIPIFGHALKYADFIPVDRKNRKAGKAATDVIQEKIKSGIRVWVAPEGTRSSEPPNMGDFKKGAFAVAIGAQVPVQPLIIYNSYAACPKGTWFVRPGSVIDVEVLPQIPTKGLKLEDCGELAMRVQVEMQKKITGFMKK